MYAILTYDGFKWSVNGEHKTGEIIQFDNLEKAKQELDKVRENEDACLVQIIE